MILYIVVVVAMYIYNNMAPQIVMAKYKICISLVCSLLFSKKINFLFSFRAVQEKFFRARAVFDSNSRSRMPGIGIWCKLKRNS